MPEIKQTLCALRGYLTYGLVALSNMIRFGPFFCKKKCWKMGRAKSMNCNITQPYSVRLC